MADEPATERGITRRKLLQRGAIVGGLAWAAPVVGTTVAPDKAGAVSAVGCYRFDFTPSTACAPVLSSAALTTCGVASPCGTATQVTSGSANAGILVGPGTPSGTKTSGKCTGFHLTVQPGYSCRIVRYYVNDGSCVGPVDVNTNDLSISNRTDWTELYVFVQCP